MTFLQSRYNFQITLSPKELLEISDEVSRGFAPVFSTRIPGSESAIKLSPQEMFDISELISREFAPRVLNTPELMLLPIDPDHVYAYWNLGENNAGAPANEEVRQPLTLRIYSEPSAAISPTPERDIVVQSQGSTAWFDIEIHSPRAQQTVSLPVHTGETRFSAVIGKRNSDNSLVASTYSNIIRVPRGGIAMQLYDDEGAVFNTLPPPMIVGQQAKYFLRKNASGQGNSIN
ncbi:MAG: DUF4912 domain-containing protein [Methylovulum sp.]|nr:DUF4912 domain-containing protein [Methylovulum sp.]